MIKWSPLERQKRTAACDQVRPPRVLAQTHTDELALVGSNPISIFKLSVDLKQRETLSLKDNCFNVVANLYCFPSNHVG